MILKILTGVSAVIGLLLVTALFLKKEYAVVRDVGINQPKAVVFNYIKYLRHQDHYSKWATIDPGMKKEYHGTDGTAGFMYAWDSEDRKAGKGEQVIRHVEEGVGIDYNLHFMKPFEGRATARMTTDAVSENETKVTWRFRGKMPYPMNLMLLFMNMDKTIGNDLQTGLNNLKGLLEKQPVSINQNQ